MSISDLNVQEAAAEAAWQQTPTLLLCGDLNSDRNDGMPGAHDTSQAGSQR